MRVHNALCHVVVLWALVSGSVHAATVSVAVLDTGVDVTHPQLAGRGISLVSYIPDRGLEPQADLFASSGGHGTSIAAMIILKSEALAAIDSITIADREQTCLNACMYRATTRALNSRIANFSIQALDSHPIRDSAKRLTKAGVLMLAGAGSVAVGPSAYPAQYASKKWADGLIIVAGALNRERQIYEGTNPIGENSKNFGVVVSMEEDALPDARSGSWRPAGSSIATAVVSGCAAALMERFPMASAKLVASAILETASHALRTDPVFGRGMLRCDAAAKFLKEKYD